jgi:hypothetical protein
VTYGCRSRGRAAHAIWCALALFLPIPLAAQQASPVAAPQVVAPPVTPSVPTSVTPSVPTPPILNRANEALPAWVRVRGEFRERIEGFDGLGFNDTREDLYYLSRLRLNATITPARLLSCQVQAQDARVARKTVGPTGTPFRAPFDVRMAFADVGNAQRRIAVRVGRQELVYGEQRLVGHVGWLNAARTFDAAKLTVRGKRLSVDVFGASVVRILEGEFDRSGAGNRFAGAYATAPALVPGASVEPYAFWKRDVNLLTETATRGPLSLATMGVRWIGRLPAGLEYNTDTAVQTGSLGTDDVSAWAGHYTLRTPPSGSLAFRTSGEFNYASGDSDPADGTRGTFDQLYPTPHDKYGLADQVGWRNIRHLRAGIELTPWKGLPVIANYHSWWLNEKRDALYAAGGAVLARVVAGASSAHVGQEIDIQATKALTPQLQLAAGYAHIFTGAFLKEATPGASYSHPYVMATYVFLAER